MIRCLLFSSLLIGAAVVYAEYNAIIEEVHIRDVYEGYRKIYDSEHLHNCLYKNCGGKTCALSYDSKTKVCVVADLELFSMACNMGIPFYATGGKGWITVIVSAVPLRNDGPSALWLLDSLSRGRNLGSRLTGLDMDVTGLTFPSVGPSQTKSPRRFSYFTTTNRAFVQLQHGDEYSLKLTDHFTMATWVKNSRWIDNQAIIDSYYGVPDALRSRDNAPHLWFTIHSNLILQLQKGVHYYTTKRINETDFDWVHVAATYAGKGKAHIYVNGKKQKIWLNKYPKTSNILQPTFIEIGRRRKTRFLSGSLACMAIYERALNQSEVQHLMNSCP